MKLYRIEVKGREAAVHVWANAKAHAIASVLNHDDSAKVHSTTTSIMEPDAMANACLLMQSLLTDSGGDWVVLWSGLDAVIYLGKTDVNHINYSAIDTPSSIVAIVRYVIESYTIYNGTGEAGRWPGLDHLVYVTTPQVDSSLLCSITGCINELYWSRMTNAGVVFICNDHMTEGDDPFDPRCGNCGMKSIDQQACISCNINLCPHCIHEACLTEDFKRVSGRING